MRGTLVTVRQNGGKREEHSAYLIPEGDLRTMTRKFQLSLSEETFSIEDINGKTERSVGHGKINKRTMCSIAWRYFNTVHLNLFLC